MKRSGKRRWKGGQLYYRKGKGLDEIQVIKAWFIEQGRLRPGRNIFFVSERQLPLSNKTAWVAIRVYWEKNEELQGTVP